MEYTQNSTGFRASKSTEHLERFIFYPEDLKLPVDWKPKRKLVAEVGFGNGELMTRMAKSRPDDLFVGIENSEISTEKAAKRALKLDLGNVRIIRADARFAVRELFGEETVDLLLAFYPIPWPKESDKTHRLFSEEFLKSAVSILKPEGKFVIVTDDRGYLEWTENNIKNLGISFVENELVPIRSTKYGRKWEEQGRRSWSLVSEAKRFEIKRIAEECEMPHAHIKKVDFEKLKALSAGKFMYGGTVVQFKGLFKGEEGYLIRTIAVDDGFTQMYTILLKQKGDEWLARLDDFAKVFKTPAVKKSIEVVAENV